MALANKELCQRIYLAYKDVFDEIFVSVKGMAPQSTSRGGRIRTFTVTLGQLVERGILSMQDTLYARYKRQEYFATLKEMTQGVVGILYNEIPYETPSRVATDISGIAQNGWTFWSVGDEHGEPKGSLSELRRQLDLDSNE